MFFSVAVPARVFLFSHSRWGGVAHNNMCPQAATRTVSFGPCGTATKTAPIQGYLLTSTGFVRTNVYAVTHAMDPTTIFRQRAVYQGCTVSRVL